jgi:trans-aconitate methyltransferase
MEWQLTQNSEYLTLLRKRLSEPVLIWVEQFVDIINAHSVSRELQEAIKINDYGCNVGHFYRGIASLMFKADYCGYDISETYLKIARDAFPNAIFENLDIAGSQPPRVADISIISATLEHIPNHISALENIFNFTNRLVILRTFVGDKYLNESCLTDGAEEEYLIKQFCVDDLVKHSKTFGWSLSIIEDKATGGLPKLVCNGRSISRTQKILIFTNET